MRPRDIVALRQKGSKGYRVPGRRAAAITTTSLNVNQGWTGTINLAESFNLIDIATNVAARVRLYSTADAMAADLARAIGTDPADGSGIIFEFATGVGLLSAALSPVVFGYSLENPAQSHISIAVTRLASGSGTVEVTLGYQPMGV